MNCANCGSPYDLEEVRAGVCSSCKTVLPHALKPAEPLVPVPAAPAPARSVAPLVMVGALLGVVGVGGVAAFLVMAPSARPVPASRPVATVAEPPVEPSVVATVAVAPLPSAAPAGAPGKREPAAKPAPSVAATGNARVIGTAQPRFERCYRAEVAKDPNAPKRYTLVLTIEDSGAVSSADVLSLASAEMKACLVGVARSLVFPPGSATRETTTLRFGAER